MIPLCLVTGFLGSGKTTLLTNWAESEAGRGVVFLVNDFGEIDVDGALMRGADQHVVSVAGGSIFCRCLVTEFINALADLPERFAPAGVVVEASGIADPRVAGKMLAETGLDRVYDLRAVWTVVDPGRFLKLLHTLPNIRFQVEAADGVLVNKTDLYPGEIIGQAEAEIRAIHPGVRVERCVRCAAEIDPFAPGAARETAGDYAPCADPNYVRFALPGDGISAAALRAGIARLGADIYRMKGFVSGGDGGAQYVDYAGHELETRPAGGESAPGLVVIARADAKDRVREWTDQFRR